MKEHGFPGKGRLIQMDYFYIGGEGKSGLLLSILAILLSDFPGEFGIIVSLSIGLGLRTLASDFVIPTSCLGEWSGM